MAAFLLLQMKPATARVMMFLIAHLVYKEVKQKNLIHVLVTATLKNTFAVKQQLYSKQEKFIQSAFSDLKKWDCFKNPVTDSERF